MAISRVSVRQSCLASLLKDSHFEIHLSNSFFPQKWLPGGLSMAMYHTTAIFITSHDMTISRKGNGRSIPAEGVKQYARLDCPHYMCSL